MLALYRDLLLVALTVSPLLSLACTPSLSPPKYASTEEAIAFASAIVKGIPREVVSRGVIRIEVTSWIKGTGPSMVLVDGFPNGYMHTSCGPGPEYVDLEKEYGFLLDGAPVDGKASLIKQIDTPKGKIYIRAIPKAFFTPISE